MKKQKNKIKSETIKTPKVAVDVLVFTIKENYLNVLLIKISRGPYKDKWALPGRSVELSETLDEAARDVLREKGGIRGIYLEQLYSFGDIKRDVRKRIISVAYFALVDSNKFRPKTTKYYSTIDWREINKLPIMAFDHRKIIKLGLERLRNKIEYSNIAYGLLPREFTLTGLQKVYETILGRNLDKRNFRKKIRMLNIIEPAKKKKYGQRNRPAELYHFKKRSLIFTK